MASGRAICGEMAGNPILTPLLLGMGVDEFSASPGAVPLVKDVIRHIRFSEAQDLAEAARGTGHRCGSAGALPGPGPAGGARNT